MPWWSFLTANREREQGTPDYYLEGLDLASQERFHEALTSLRLALRERPGDVATLEQMAVVYTKMGMTDEAIKMYQRALEKMPGSSGAHYGLAFLFLNRGNTADAAHHLEAFLASGPELPEAERHVAHARATLAALSADSNEAPFED